MCRHSDIFLDLGDYFLTQHVEEKALWREKVAWTGGVRISFATHPVIG